jgi:hypothetical protein
MRSRNRRDPVTAPSPDRCGKDSRQTQYRKSTRNPTSAATAKATSALERGFSRLNRRVRRCRWEWPTARAPGGGIA